MTEKTPEGVAIHNVLLSLFCWVDTKNDKPAESKIFINARETIDECTRAAVEAETERCANADELLVTCDLCGAAKEKLCTRPGPGGSMYSIAAHSHPVRIRAAIRARQ